MSFEDLKGRRFHRLLVLSYAGRTGTKQTHAWMCRCDCGEKRIIRGDHLRAGQKSCGCFGKEVRIKKHTTHGMSRSKDYFRWQGMIERCKPMNKDHKNYYDKGVMVCDRWSKSFEAFISDMGKCPKEKTSIDRINSDGNYEPGNCRWATWSQQSRNKRTNRLLEFRGITRCVTDWAKELGISRCSIFSRLCRGWSVERILTTPIRKQKK